MKKLLTIALAAVTASAFAAFDTTQLDKQDVLAPTAVSASATNTTTFAVSGFRGRCEVILTATPAAGRTIAADLYGRNAETEAWKLVSSVVNTQTNAVVVSVPFVGEYAPDALKLEVCPAVNTTVAAFVLGYK